MWYHLDLKFKISIDKLPIIIIIIIEMIKVMFGSWKILKKKKYFDFLMFDCLIKNIKENQIKLKLVRNLWILKLFNFYIDELK